MTCIALFSDLAFKIVFILLITLLTAEHTHAKRMSSEIRTPYKGEREHLHPEIEN